MGYLDDFQLQINNRDFSKFLQLWEEYISSDSVEVEEFSELLKAIKISDFAKMVGQLIETALPLWRTIQDEQGSYEILKQLVDLQTTNTPVLAELVLEAIKKRHGVTPEFNDRLRLIGLRNRDNFQGCLSNYDLLAHIGNHKFVFHTAGWGTGEIIEVSSVREQLAVEFENVSGNKYITYLNAFKTLIPLPKEHFLARRFADADALEKEAKEDPVAVFKILLRDLGSKSAAEVKDELCELVIPEAEWTKWWQGARAKIKKDTMIESPEGVKGLFRLRKKEVLHEDRLTIAINDKTSVKEIMQTSYNFVRDQPNIFKRPEVKASLIEKLLPLFKDKSLTASQELELLILLDAYFAYPIEGKLLPDYIKKLNEIEKVVCNIEIIAIKKKALILIREHRQDWIPLFSSFLLSISQGLLRDYIIKELNQEGSRETLIEVLEDLLKNPQKHPEFFVWYFQKIVGGDGEKMPFSDKEGQRAFFEAFFILYSLIESKPEYRDLLKKMYMTISGKRYAVVRSIFEGTSLEYLKEILLLTSKCQTLSDHDIKILRSLAEVVQPSLAPNKSHRPAHDINIIWTTEAGYHRVQARVQQVGTVEIVENAREIEAARALGDLRENSEYKFALEKRSRLQGELKTLSDQLKRARMITKGDIYLDEVGIGSVVTLRDLKDDKVTTYTILGPWDADVDANILSSQSKFIQAMMGLKIGSTFKFRDEEYEILELKSYLDK